MPFRFLQFNDVDQKRVVASRARSVEGNKINHEIDIIGNEILDDILYYSSALKSGNKKKRYRNLDGTLKETSRLKI